jgi:hypothetical protein
MWNQKNGVSENHTALEASLEQMWSDKKWIRKVRKLMKKKAAVAR